MRRARGDVATELGPSEFAAAIGVKADQLPELERAGLPFVNKKKQGHVYPLPDAVRWYVDRELSTRVAAVPPRVTQKELARLVGYSPRQLTNLVDDNKLTTIVESGKRFYPTDKCVQEIIKHREALARGKSGDAASELDEVKLRKERARAEREELDLLKERGELIARPLAERAIGELLTALKAQLVQFPSRYESDLVGLENRVKVRAILKPAVHQEIQRLSAAAAQVGRRIQMIDAAADGDDDGADIGEADDADDAS